MPFNRVAKPPCNAVGCAMGWSSPLRSIAERLLPPTMEITQLSPCTYLWFNPMRCTTGIHNVIFNIKYIHWVYLMLFFLILYTLDIPDVGFI